MSGEGQVIDYCYEFGRAIAHAQRDLLTMEEVIDLTRSSGLSIAHGSDGQIRAMMGAFDEFKRLAMIEKGSRRLDGA